MKEMRKDMGDMEKQITEKDNGFIGYEDVLIGWPPGYKKGKSS